MRRETGKHGSTIYPKRGRLNTHNFHDALQHNPNTLDKFVVYIFLYNAEGNVCPVCELPGLSIHFCCAGMHLSHTTLRVSRCLGHVCSFMDDNVILIAISKFI